MGAAYGYLMPGSRPQHHSASHLHCSHEPDRKQYWKCSHGPPVRTSWATTPTCAPALDRDTERYAAPVRESVLSAVKPGRVTLRLPGYPRKQKSEQPNAPPPKRMQLLMHRP